MHLSPDPWIWVSAFLTLAIFSYLYRDNPVYKFAEHMFVGVAAGYYLVQQYWQVLVPKLIRPLATGETGGGLGLASILIALALAILLVLRFSPTLGWISRWPIALMVGSYAGLAIVGNAQGDFIGQIQPNLMPFIDSAAVDRLVAARGFTEGFIAFLWVLGNPILILGLLVTLLFFFFSAEHRGVLGVSAKAGVYLLMLSFGASFGFTVMARISLLFERLVFLYTRWLGLVG